MSRPRSRAIALHNGDITIPGAERWGERWRRWISEQSAREVELRSPFLWLPVAFGIGILAYFQADREPALWAGPALALLLMPLALRLSGGARMAVLALLATVLGFSAASYRTYRLETPFLQRAGLYDVTGHVEQVDAGPRRHRLTIRTLTLGTLGPAEMPRAIRVGASGPPQAKPGDTVSFRARLSPPSEAAMPGGYDFRRDAYFRQIGANGFAIGSINVVEAKPPPDLWFTLNATIDHWRNLFTDRIARRIGGESGALSAALITGKRGLISDETNDDLRASGLYHIVSISGLHMVLAAGIFFWIARAGLAAIPSLTLRWPIKKIAALFAMAGASFYCIFSGNEVATERSLIMTLVMLGAILFDRPALAMRNLAISALLVLAREPEALIGPSFQMSFAAVACLIAANQVWVDWRGAAQSDRQRVLERGALKLLLAFGGIVATTVVATLATAPFGAWHFHRINPLGIIGNALAIPLVSIVVMPCAVIGTLLLPFGLDWIIWLIMGEGVRGVLFVANMVAMMDFASVAVPRRSLFAFLLTVLALLVFTGLRTRLRYASALILIAALPIGRAAPLPDIVTDAQGRLVLIRGEDQRYHMLAVQSPSSFTLQQWLPALGDLRRPDDPTLRKRARCDRSGCMAPLADGRIVALSANLAALREDCTRATIIIATFNAGDACKGTAAILYDRRHFDRFGATHLTAEGARWSQRTALDPDVTRPWRRAVVAPPITPPATRVTPPAPPREPDATEELMPQ